MSGDQFQASLGLNKIPPNIGGNGVRTVMDKFIADEPLSVQKANGIVFGKPKGGEIKVLMLQQAQDRDSIVFHILCDDGTGTFRSSSTTTS